MTIRTTGRTVTFTKPFVLAGIDEAIPPGAYLVETDEELIDGVSFPAWRRTGTLIHLHRAHGRTETLPISAEALDRALQSDRSAAPTGRET